MADSTIPETPTIVEDRVAAAELLPVTIAEEPVTIAEEPLETPVTNADEPVTIAPKRKPGRPQGSKNKEVGKPRKPREKKVVFEEPIESVPRVGAELPYEELPRATPGSLPIPTEAYDLRTAKMLRLLQMQTDHRKQQKANVYSSWFR